VDDQEHKEGNKTQGGGSLGNGQPRWEKRGVEFKEEDHQEGDNQGGVGGWGKRMTKFKEDNHYEKDDQKGEEGGKAQGDDLQEGDDQD
jgi:hypothetical protein